MNNFAWTTFCWANQLNPAGKYSKVPLMRKGFQYVDFAYGTYTGPQWSPFNPDSQPIQYALICSPSTHLLVIDVDHPDAYAETRTANVLGAEHAMSTRGEGYHVALDMRGIHPARWPRQGAIGGTVERRGADIKALGFVPVPGSQHYKGGYYEARLNPDGSAKLIVITEEILAALHADRGASYSAPHGGGGPGGQNAGEFDHDTRRAAYVMRAVLAGLSLDEIHCGWLQLPDHNENCSSSAGFTEEDFGRHYQGALRKEKRMADADAALWGAMMGGARS